MIALPIPLQHTERLYRSLEISSFSINPTRGLKRYKVWVITNRSSPQTAVFFDSLPKSFVVSRKEKNGFCLDMHVFSKFKSIIVQSESHTSSRSYTQKPTPNKWLANIIDKISLKSQVKKSLIITH